MIEFLSVPNVLLVVTVTLVASGFGGVTRAWLNERDKRRAADELDRDYALSFLGVITPSAKGLWRWKVVDRETEKAKGVLAGKGFRTLSDCEEAFIDLFPLAGYEVRKGNEDANS